MRSIFVFGSNLAGRHGAGAALAAVAEHGAVYGRGFGLQGNSFAIPTKDANLKTLPLGYITGYVDRFLEFAREHPELVFQVTPIGCGLAGYKAAQIAPMFAAVVNPGNPISNVELPRSFRDQLEDVLVSKRAAAQVKQACAATE